MWGKELNSEIAVIINGIYIGFQDDNQAAVLEIKLITQNLTSKTIVNETNACRTLTV